MKHVALIAAASLSLGMVAAWAKPDDQPKKTESRLEAVLESIDTKARTITVRVGKSVDEVLTEMLKHPGEKPKLDGGKKQILPLANRVEVTISFRSSPSVANHLERTLKDLDAMIGYPITVEPAKGPISKIVAWRGTPWKIVPSK